MILRRQHRSPKRHSADAERGFTLMETCIALVIMMISALAAASLFVLAINYNSQAYDASAALAIAQQRMERLRKTSFTATSLNTPSTTETAVGFGRTYNVVTTICSTSDCGGSATLKLITIQVSPASAPDLWVATVTSQRATPATGPYLR